MRLTLLLSLQVISACLSAQTINTGPWLQDAEPSSIRIMWETTNGDESTVQWGTTQALGGTASGSVITGNGNSRIHEVQLTGLQPATRYWYSVQTGAAIIGPFDFVTPPARNAEAPFTFVAVSDMQRDWTNPTVWGNINTQGIIPYTLANYSGDLPTDLAFMMIPGDLVDNGTNYAEWETTFFDPAQPLLQHVPHYPVAGNHELDSPNYFKYHHLPDNGTAGYEEHWWYKDYSNVRLIGLESNSGYRIQEQLDWLQAVLDSVCADPMIDFVFAQLHHPHHSELWPDGNLDYTGQCIAILEQFSTQCDKPSVHFYGHTHGYSRGESRDHRHLMVNVAVAGGNIDYWGEFGNQTDYPEHSISEDDYGFVMLDVTAGDAPEVLLSRLSRGDATTTLNNVLMDTMRIRFNDIRPAQPTGLFPAQGDQWPPECIVFKGSPYVSGNNALHGATHWQIATDAAFTNLVIDEWKQHQNWYYEVDLQAGDDLTDEMVQVLSANTTYHWRLRYRNRSLTWSDWSDAIQFQTTQSVLTANLLLNGDAENGTTGWTATAGVIESLTANECGATVPFAGTKFFCVGGACNDNAYGEAFQQINLNGYVSEVDAGTVSVNFGAMMRNWSGNDDRPEMRVKALNQSGTVLGTSPTIGTLSGSWVAVTGNWALPVGTRSLSVELMGTRNVGADNDSYVDDAFARLNLSAQGCAQMPVSVSEATDHPSLLFPNPNSGRFNVMDRDGINGIAITDLSGREVMAVNGNAQETVPMNLSIGTGLYLLRMMDILGNTTTHRLVISERN
jgi:hypothetical protein